MIRAELITQTKFACGCAIGHDGCPYCTGLPGAHALPNAAAVGAALALVEALGGDPVGFGFVRALCGDAPRGYRIATESIAAGGQLDGEAVEALWIEEGARGQALLCVQTRADASALDDALAAAGIRAAAAEPIAPKPVSWHPMPDQPGVLPQQAKEDGI